MRPGSTRAPQQPCPWIPFHPLRSCSEFKATWSAGHSRGRIVHSVLWGAAIRDDQYATEHGPIGSHPSRADRGRH